MNPIKLHIWQEWLCEKCGKRQLMEDNEEWQKCCNTLMRMQAYRKFVAEEQIEKL